MNLARAIRRFLADAGPDAMVLGRAKMRVSHKRPYDYDEKRGIWVLREVDEPEEVWNLITNVGRIQIHKGAYATSGIQSNGFNYVALSNDTVTETASSTTLSNEIAANGLTRAQGAVTLPTGSGTVTTVDKTFTATGSQSAQKAALFDASSVGNMNHVLGFTQRALITNDTLQATFSLTIS
jgi:hypothetical protein